MVGAQRQRSAMSPHGVRGSAQILQPGERVTSKRVFMKHGEESLQIIANEHCNLRVGKNAPHGTRQILVTHFRNPAPSGVVNRYRQARMKHGARLLGKAAPGKIDLS
jgi:hypothetical protein